MIASIPSCTRVTYYSMYYSTVQCTASATLWASGPLLLFDLRVRYLGRSTRRLRSFLTERYGVSVLSAVQL